MNNNTSNPTPSPSSGSNPGTGSPNLQDAAAPARCVLEPLCSAVNEGTHRARVAAGKAIPRIRAAVSGATYWLGFGASFAAVFSYVIVKELAPEALKAGCCEGARAGQRNAEDLASRARPGFQSAPVPAAKDPSEPTAQPGLA